MALSFFKTDPMQGLRSRFIEVVIVLGQKNYRGLRFYQKNKGNSIVKYNFEKHRFLVLPIPKNWSICSMFFTHFSVTNINCWPTRFILDF